MNLCQKSAQGEGLHWNKYGTEMAVSVVGRLGKGGGLLMGGGQHCVVAWECYLVKIHYSQTISAEKLRRKQFRRTFGNFGGKNFGRKKIRRKKIRRAFSPKFFPAEISGLVFISIHLEMVFSET